VRADVTIDAMSFTGVKGMEEEAMVDTAMCCGCS
jgi:hypothetical protein